MVTGRATKSQEAREARLSSLRSREASARATETPEAREARLANTRSRVAAGRATESEEARDSCLASLRSRSADARAREMPEATSSRRTFDQGRIRASRLRVWQDKRMAAFNYDPTIDYVNDPMVKIGKMGDIKCPHCKALKWTGEIPGMCCAGGKVKLPSLGIPPEPLKSLLSGQHPRSREFLTNARKYNSCFQMTLFGGEDVNHASTRGWMPTFWASGQVYHKIGSMQPAAGQAPQFLQIYFMGDHRQQSGLQCSIQQGLN